MCGYKPYLLFVLPVLFEIFCFFGRYMYNGSMFGRCEIGRFHNTFVEMA